MAKKSSVKARKKAVQKLDKAVKKAVKKGVPQDELEQTVNDAMERAVAKQQPVKRRAPRTSGRNRKASVSTATVRDEDLD
ncbi:hypothetical protein H7849_23445 [Alloacidobacterium dinghuense]|uniref:Uncharacterized protein n=1 Tax=Alloacidobacterium dinghuense TaxID=2763107 RepID=A0A7G8BHC1_9BACT|nr:hypothetical protein [Alloacidobacterium dinghuense]QNI31941.1 hypothetical protein H7849_23445 [Alloacidobacterium dinghuense]